jgi:excisionase family DNA binding protein
VTEHIHELPDVADRPRPPGQPLTIQISRGTFDALVLAAGRRSCSINDEIERRLAASLREDARPRYGNRGPELALVPPPTPALPALPAPAKPYSAAARADADAAVGRWIDECCTLDQDAETLTAALFLSFKGWATSHGEPLPQSTRGLSLVLASYGFGRASRTRGRVVIGLRLNEPMAVPARKRVTMVSVEQAARVLGISTGTLYRLINTGEFEGALRFGRRVLIPAPVLRAKVGHRVMLR